MLTKVPRVTLGRAQRAFWPHGGAMRATPATQKMQAMGRNFWTFVFPTHPAVKFTMGNYSGVVKEGLRLKIPYIHRFVRVDVRTQVKDIPVQKFLTKGRVILFWAQFLMGALMCRWRNDYRGRETSIQSG